MKPIAGFLLLAAWALAACNPISMAVNAGATVGQAAIQERGVGGSADDAALKFNVSEAYFRASERIFLKVTVRVYDSRAVLIGGLPEKELRDRAVALAWEQAGLREVIDELQDVEVDLGGYARDAWIGAQIGGALLFDEGVLAVNYSVDVINGVVYLTGVAQDQTELDRVIHLAGDVRHVKKVVSHVLLKNDPRRSLWKNPSARSIPTQPVPNRNGPV